MRLLKDLRSFGGGGTLSFLSGFYSLSTCKSKKICYNGDMGHHNLNGGFMKKAFTLAEILITLGIIGVVAALTMPSLIQKHQEQVTVNKVKKFYSVMSNALTLAITDNGTLDQWSVKDELKPTQQSAEDLMGYLKPYLRIVKDCGTSSGCLDYKNNVTFLSGGQHINYDTINSYYKFIMNDGTYAYLRSTLEDGAHGFCKVSDGGWENSCGGLFIDINGKKAPNTVGKDIFLFIILKDRIAPVKLDADGEECGMKYRGFNCSGYIIQKGNMDYLHKKD